MAVLSLALGIGASTAMFSILYSMLLRPLPYPQPEKLVSLAEKHISAASRGPVSAANFYDWKDQSRAFSSVAAYTGWSLNMTGTDTPERLKGALVSPELFDVLGVLPVRGRTFMPDEDQSAKVDRLYRCPAFRTSKPGGNGDHNCRFGRLAETI